MSKFAQTLATFVRKTLLVSVLTLSFACSSEEAADGTPEASNTALVNAPPAAATPSSEPHASNVNSSAPPTAPAPCVSATPSNPESSSPLPNLSTSATTDVPLPSASETNPQATAPEPAAGGNTSAPGSTDSGGASTEGGAAGASIASAGNGGIAQNSAGASGAESETSLSGAGGAESETGTGGQAPIGPLNAVMVVRGAGTPTAGDEVMLALIEAHGFEVTILSDAAVQAADVEAMDLIVISSSAESAPLGTKLLGLAVPMLCVENGQYRNEGMTGGSRDTHWGEIADQTAIAISGTASELVGGLTGTVVIADSAGPLGWGQPGAAALVGATIADNPSQAVVFGYEQGAQMVDGTAPARRAGFAIRENLAANLNDDGKALFNSVLTWVLE